MSISKFSSRVLNSYFNKRVILSEEENKKYEESNQKVQGEKNQKNRGSK